ncbi:hypothetical protein AVEN_94047-1 [Araneus ventricosus]|uniref:Uncharacterized protein n=1 Tax=Araneus ventricosus TaxID=182803 RepID=A0A4Y2HVZ8_ARAVE|nr:hypothetical protein AVEN_94047-1 [Araneus ventricosus]
MDEKFMVPLALGSAEAGYDPSLCVTDLLRSFPDITSTQPVHSLSSDAVTPASKKVRCSILFPSRMIQSHLNHPVHILSIPVGVGRLYAARTSNTLPFCERMKRSLGDMDISTVQVYHIDFFSFLP